MNRIKQIINIILGSLFIVLGVIGFLLPVIPSTPFLIIAGLFYIKSSKKLYNRLISTRLLGIHIKNYVEEKKVTYRLKVVSITFLWIPTLITEIFIIKNVYVRSIPIVIVLLLTIHILTLKTIEDIEN